MKRTTIMADEETLERLKEAARRENLSLAELVRQGIELRLAQSPRRLSFIGSGASKEPPFDTAARAGEIDYTPDEWRSS